MRTPKTTPADASTEERIRLAARKVFTHKGYAATRVRDIAEEAGINIALLNYYFRSKERLFEIIMMENVQRFAGTIIPIASDPATQLMDKVEALTSFYIDMLLENPGLPLFLINVINTQPEKLALLAGMKNVVPNLSFFTQIRQATEAAGTVRDPFQLIVTLMGMIVFPFIGRPLIQTLSGRDDATFRTMMLERKKLAPAWFQVMLQTL